MKHFFSSTLTHDEFLNPGSQKDSPSDFFCFPTLTFVKSPMALATVLLGTDIVFFFFFLGTNEDEMESLNHSIEQERPDGLTD